jgi:hypothetical protein
MYGRNSLYRALRLRFKVRDIPKELPRKILNEADEKYYRIKAGRWRKWEEN